MTDRKKYWIRFYWSECVLCGKRRNSRERVYNEPKPDDITLRHLYGPEWACDSHFM